MIEFTNARKAYGENVVLNDVNFSIAKGEVVAILGASGAGKSTIINCLNGLVTLDSGAISVDGLSVNQRKDLQGIRRKCATVFQNFNLYPHMSIVENITLAPQRVLRISPEVALEKAMALLESVDLQAHAGKYPNQLSGGQKQRVGICRALAMDPDVLLLDEITSSLDPEMTAEVTDVLGALVGQNMTMILVTHELNVARRIASRIMFLDTGKILADTDKETFFSEPFFEENPRIKNFMQSSGDV